LQNQFQLQSEIKIVNLQNLMRIIPAIDIIDGNVFACQKGITTPRLFIMKTAWGC
jgi:hypothetical protein